MNDGVDKGFGIRSNFNFLHVMDLKMSGEALDGVVSHGTEESGLTRTTFTNKSGASTRTDLKFGSVDQVVLAEGNLQGKVINVDVLGELLGTHKSDFLNNVNGPGVDDGFLISPVHLGVQFGLLLLGLLLGGLDLFAGLHLDTLDTCIQEGFDVDFVLVTLLELVEEHLGVLILKGVS